MLLRLQPFSVAILVTKKYVGPHQPMVNISDLFKGDSETNMAVEKLMVNHWT